MTSRILSRSLLAAASVAAVGAALTLSPSGVSVARGCSGSNSCYMAPAWTSFGLTTQLAAVPREGLLIDVTTTPSACPGAPDPKTLVIVARRGDGSTVPGAVSAVRIPPADIRSSSSKWVMLWKPDTTLDPSASYTLEVTGTVGGGGGAGAGGTGVGGAGAGGAGGSGGLASLPFVTIGESATFTAPSVTASLSSKATVVERPCCAVPSSGFNCEPTRSCVDAVTTTYRELSVSLALGPSAAMAPFTRYEVHDSVKGLVRTLDGWDGPIGLPVRSLLDDSVEHCVFVEATLLVTGEVAKSPTVCPTPITVDSTLVPHCAETKELVASCPVTNKMRLEGSADDVLTKYCGGAAAGDLGGTSTAPTSPDSGCTIEGSRGGAGAGWLLALVGLAAVRCRRTITKPSSQTAPFNR